MKRLKPVKIKTNYTEFLMNRLDIYPMLPLVNIRLIIMRDFVIDALEEDYEIG